MKQPFWILNSSLIAILLVCSLIIFFSDTTLGPKKSIEPSPDKVHQKPATPINLQTIYKSDLFGTFDSGQIAPTKIEHKESKLPPPPQPVIVPIPAEPTDKFLEPMDIKLTGTITLTDESKNRAIILDTRTKTQASYRVGDDVEDAQLIRIFRNKVIFLRSNGQQEIIFLDQEEALINDPTPNWKQIIDKLSETTYLVDPNKFIEKISNISELIHQLNLSGALKDGKSIGVKVGAGLKDGLAPALGLDSGDIITEVNGIDVNDAEKIYNEIKKPTAKSVVVKLLRNNKPETFTYNLKKLVLEPSKEKKEKGDEELQIDQRKVEKEKLKILKEKYKFAPTAFELKMKEEQNMKKLAGNR